MRKYTAYKKSILSGIGFLFFMTGVAAQDIARVEQLYSQKKLPEAKEAIDSVTNTGGSSAAAYLLKANIYNSIAKDLSLQNLTADGKQEAFNALQSATALDKTYVTAQLQPQYALAWELYSGYTNDGLAYYNAGVERNNKTGFGAALVSFKKAGTVRTFITANAWGTTAIDTANLYYCAKAAINADNETDAVIYCKKIADNYLIQTSLSKGYEDIYKWLAYYYKQQQLAELFNRYCAIGAKQFPQSVYFSLLQVDWLRQQGDYMNMFAFYQDILEKQPGHPGYQLAFFNDLYNYVFQGGEPVNDKTFYTDSLEKGLLKYLGKNPAANDARLLLGKLYTNEAASIVKETGNSKKITVYRSLLIKANSQFQRIIRANNGKNKSALYSEAFSLWNANKRRMLLLKTNSNN